ncbi:MAG: 2'-5' RNA ligase family protein [Anaerolineaceae bacterium]|jgi:2'-5' RNA ligase
MQALVTALPKPYEDEVYALWDDLETRFGSKFVRITPIPHFSWQVGESYDLDQVVPMLSRLTLKLEPFQVWANGVNFFVSQTPIVFIKLMKEPYLLRMHTQLWEMMETHTLRPNLLYNTSMWTPHITLALQDVNWDDLKAVMQHLSEKKIDWHFTVDNLSILCQPDSGAYKLQYTFKFGQGLVAMNTCNS